jgi:hypothetical protein
MSKAFWSLLGLLVLGCAGLIHMGKVETPLAMRSEQSARGVTVDVRVMDSESLGSGYCAELAGGLSCEFSVAYLQDNPEVRGEGGWLWLQTSTARALCERAMRQTQQSTAAEVDACGWALMGMRLKELRPVAHGEEE